MKSENNVKKYLLSDEYKNLIISISLGYLDDAVLPPRDTVIDLTKRLMMITHSNYALFVYDTIILSCFKDAVGYKRVDRLSSILASYATAFIAMKEKQYCSYEVIIDCYSNIDEVREKFQFYRFGLLPVSHIWYDRDTDTTMEAALSVQLHDSNTRAEYETFLSKHLIEQQGPY